MAKQITQESFDAVVKENIEEFEMSREEAVEDAVKQFEAQGVCLDNIVKDHSNSEQGSNHGVVDALNQLSHLLEQDPLNRDELITVCSKIQQECDIDLAHRCLASSNNAYNILFDACQKTKESDLLLIVLNAMCALCNGQPDVLDMRGTLFFVELLRSHCNSLEVVASCVRLIRLTCVMHESNRQGYVSADLIPVLMNVLETHKDNAGIVKEVCFGLRVLTFDDDLRVPFGKAHEHAKMIVTEADALSKILRICKDYVDDKDVLGELFLTLSKLAVRNEFCQEIMELGGLDLMLQALGKNIEHKAIVVQALKVLKAIAGNDTVKVAIVKSGGAHMILDSMTTHLKNPNICEAGSAAIATIVLRNPDHCNVVMEAKGADVLVKVLALHPEKSLVQKQVCIAIRNLVARSRQYCPAFLELGVEALLQRALATHKECHDLAKAALRDLECDVQFNILWKGEGKGIQH